MPGVRGCDKWSVGGATGKDARDLDSRFVDRPVVYSFHLLRLLRSDPQLLAVTRDGNFVEPTETLKSMADFDPAKYGLPAWDAKVL